MRTLLLAATFAFLGAAASFAQGLPAGTTPRVYGAEAFPNARYHDQTIWSEWLRGPYAGEITTGTVTRPLPGTGRTARNDRH